MNNKSIKTHFDSSVLLTFLILFITGVALFSFRKNSKVDCTNIDFKIISNSYTTEDLIEFKSIDASGVEWKWDLGDKTKPMYKSNIAHQFKKEGVYNVTLQMNGQCVTSKEIVIEKKKILISPELIPNISFPNNIRVGDLVTFANESTFAKSWQWSFGETTLIDGTKKVEEYTFKTPGEKTILLVVNGDRLHEAKQRIVVLEPLKKEKKKKRRNDYIEQVLTTQIEDGPPPENDEKIEAIEKINISPEEIKQMVISYSTRNMDDREIREYFCYSNIPVFNKNGKRVAVNEFFKEVRDARIKMKDIKLIKDHEKGCIKSMTIDMKIKKGVLWKNF